MNREERRRQKSLNQTKAPSGLSEGDKAAHTQLEKARALFEKGAYAEADDLCQDVSASMPLDADPFHLRALIQYRLGNMSLAGDMILEAITRNDTDPEIHANCGAIMNMLGRYAEAEAACRHVISLRPRRADAYGHMAVALEMQGRFDEAIDAAREALKHQSNYPEARINLGNLLVRKCDFIGAVEAYAKVIDASPENPTARANMSLALLRLGEPEAAETLAREALDLNPDYPEALIALGNALSAQMQYPEALQAFNKALELRPQSIEATLCRSSALLQKGELDEAEAACRDLIVNEEAAAEVFVGLGTVLTAKDQFDAAADAFRSAIAIKPGLAEGHRQLASVLGAAISKAELEALQKISDDPKTTASDRVRLTFTLADILDERGDEKKAFATYTAANKQRKSLLTTNDIEFDPDVFDAHIEVLMKAFSGPQKPLTASRVADQLEPVFLVGVPNAGMALVERLLSAHPNVVSLGNAATVMGLIGDDPQNLFNEGDAENEAFAELLEDVGLMFSPSGSAERIIDTTPLHFLYLGVIELLFPKARIIHCQRDKTDLGLACYFEDFGMADAWATDVAHIKRFVEAEAHLMTHWKQVLQTPVLTVPYEMLISDMDTSINQLFAFLGIDDLGDNTGVRQAANETKDFQKYNNLWVERH